MNALAYSSVTKWKSLIETRACVTTIWHDRKETSDGFINESDTVRG
jgi:hypothetical protein